MVLGVLALGSAIVFGGPGQKWYYSIRHYRWLRAAQSAFDRGDLPTTSWTARRVLERDPTNLRAVRLLAKTARQQGTRDAIYWQSRVVELDPDEPANLLEWAKIAREFNELATAVIALGRMPESARQTVAYANVAAEIAEAQGNADLAARHLDAALALAPGTPETRLHLAAMQLRAHSELVRSEGRATLDQLKSEPRWRQDALLALAREAVTGGRAPEALEATHELLAWGYLGREEQLLRAEALKLANSADFPAYLRSLQAAVASPGPSSPADLNAGHLVEWMGRQKLGGEALLWATALPPEIGKVRPTALAIAQLETQGSDWLALRAWTKDPTWANDEPLRMGYHALALVRGPSELRPPGAPESLWAQALKSASSDPARLERLANWTAEWNLPQFAESSWWALANAADDPGRALDQLSVLYRQRTDAHGRFRVARRRLEFHPMDRLALAEVAYLGLLLEVTEPDPAQLVEILRRQPPLATEAVKACALSLWRQERVREAVPLFESLPIPTREDPSLAWFYGTVLSAAGDVAKASRYLALGANFPRSPEEEALFREARLRLVKR